MGDLLYEDLCYKLTGLAYKIDNQFGFGFEEKFYSDAFEKLLIKENISYKREVYSTLKIEGEIIKKHYFDFLIEDKLIIELKSNERKYKDVCSQLFQYLKASKLKLGLVIRFTKDGVKTKRIPNLY